MSDIGSSQPLVPVWSIDHPETLLWRGVGRVTGQRADRETELVVIWQLELDVRFRQEPNDAEDLELFCDAQRGEVRLRLPELGIDTPVTPVGFDQGGIPVWWQASARFCTTGLDCGFTWLDRVDGAGLKEVARLWLELWQDPLWRQILPRAVTYYLEANRQGRDAPAFLEVKYTMAQAALELLAWAILKEDPITKAESRPWHQGNGAAAKNVRELLTWSGIPTAVPAELPDLAQELQEHDEWQDAADLVPWLRNQFVHPRLRDGRFGPKQEVVVAGWKLACWYVDLVLLRRLGYTGRISDRLAVDGWVGQTVPVPWAKD